MTTLPIQDIRAMLLQFEKSSLKDLFFRSADWTMFFARDGGGPNPLLSAQREFEADVTAAQLASVHAPHLGLFEPRCAVGESVAAGALLGLLDVLGRKTEILSNEGGRIRSVLVAPHALVEFGDDLVEMDVSI